MCLQGRYEFRQKIIPKPISVGIKWYLLCGANLPYIFNMILHGRGYQWYEESVGWTTAIIFNLMSGLNILSYKAKSYLDQG